MKGTHFFIAFFLLFASAMFLIPVPMFPGDTLLSLANLASSEYATYLGATINGIIYGLIAWAVFMAAMKKTERTVSKNPVKKPNGKNKRAR